MEQSKILQVLRTGGTETSVKQADETGEKRSGRPPVPADQRRRQYTITLPEEKHAVAIAAARKKGISFARLVEKALDNYI